jgi:hypothetical protein
MLACLSAGSTVDPFEMQEKACSNYRAYYMVDYRNLAAHLPNLYYHGTES